MKAIIFATLEEAEPFVQSFRRARFSDAAEGETLRDDDYLVSIAGIGKIKATLRTERLLRQFKPSEILHVGTCTTLVDKFEVGSFFAPSQVFEGDRIELAAPTYPRMPLTNPFPQFQTGTLVTQDHTVSGASELTYWQRIAEASDMTGYAVAYVAATYGVPCTILKVISGRMGQDDPDFRKTLATVQNKLASFLVKHLD
ncbi:MAG: nucleoside phosphorylase [Rhodothermales bacterium]|jgi:nucleoside phosphorylase